MAGQSKDERVAVWVQPADRALVQHFVDFCESTTVTYGHPAFQVNEPWSEPTVSALPTNTFIQKGACWNITYGPNDLHLNDSVGLRCIAHLVDRPYEQVTVIELSMRAHGTETTLAPHLMSQPVEIVDQETLTSVLDDVRQLQAEIEEARELGQESREEKARARLDELLDGVAPIIGKGGRSRSLVDVVERARQAVHSSVRRALGAIRSQAPPLAAHFKQSISISRYCTYAPAQETTWNVKFSPPQRAL